MLLSARKLITTLHNRSTVPALGDCLGAVAIPDKEKRNSEYVGRTFSASIEARRMKVILKRSCELCIDPLYLFLCGLEWRSQSNASAGWELVRCLRASGQTAKIAAILLALAADTRLPHSGRQAAKHIPNRPPPEREMALRPARRVAAR